MPDLTVDEYRWMPREALHRKLREESLKIRGVPIPHIDEKDNPDPATLPKAPLKPAFRPPMLVRLLGNITFLLTRYRAKRRTLYT